MKLGKLKPQATPEMTAGTLLHAVILENRQPYVIRPEQYMSKDGPRPWNANANACREWLETFGADSPVVSTAEHDYMQRCRNLVHSDPFARSLISACTAFEVSVFADHPDVPEGVKMRADGLAANFGLDLKTCSDASTHAASSMCARYRYHVQAAWYLDTLKLAGMPVDEFYFIFLQKSDPPRLNVRRMKASAIDLGRDEYRADLEALSYAREHGQWPDYTGDKLGELDVPAWCYSAADFATDVDVAFGGKVVTL